ncbi:PA14 domain-containing protein [Planctomycetota bacterium]
MCKKLVWLVCSILVVSLVGTVSAQLPAGWQSQDIGTTGGSASEASGTWTVSGDGADVWGTADAFHYAYVPLNGGGEITARVISNGTGSNTWSKGGVMIRETLEANSKHTIAALTDSDGGGIAFQGRPTTGGSSYSFHGDITASPPHWVRLTREDNTITGYHSADGVVWELFTDTSPDGAMSNPIDIEMADDIYIGLFVTSHAAGEVRSYTFDNVLVGLPVAAYGPVPANGAVHPDTWVSLSWQPGSTAVSHDVYFGDSEADVADGTGDTFLGNQAAAFFVVGFPGFPYPDGLVPGTTYYWRVDEVEADGVTIHTGPVWSFFVPPLTAYDPVPTDGSSFVAMDTTLSWTSGFGAKLHTVYFGTDFDTVANASGGMPQATTTYDPSPLQASTTYYWRVDEFTGATTLKGDVWSFTTAKEGGGIKGEYFNNVDLSGPPVLVRIDPQINFYWNPGPVGPGVNEDNFSVRWTGLLETPFSESFTFIIGCDDGARMFLNGELIIDDWGAGHDYTETRSQPIDLVEGVYYSIVVEGFELGGEAEWRLFWESPSLPRDYVPQAAFSLPVKARNPNPANTSTGASLMPTLRWTAGDFAASHEVYFGTDADAVRNATIASPEFKATKALGDESYDPGKLAWNTTYYWRVDEVNNLNPDSPWVGNVWRFTTGDFLLVDDFEGYTNDDGAGEAIWQHWIDGFGVADNGAQVGELMPPYAEQTIVHGGRQSMPFYYVNETGVTNSEAVLALTWPRDWTEENVAELSLWFQGDPANAAERLYVMVSNAVVPNEDPAAAQINAWTQMVIPFQAFADKGVNLTNVNQIGIGLGSKGGLSAGGSGTMYIDDIRLYRAGEATP